jgi:hypothetical protein
VAWPDPERLEAILGALAPTVAREAGIGLRGFPRVLAARTRPYLERVRAIDFAGGDLLPGALGVETEGRVRVRCDDGQSRVLRFRADRVDRSQAGLRLTDYKAGKPISAAKAPGKRREKLLEEIAAAGACRERPTRSGRLRRGPLQSGRRYLFASPDLEDGPRSRRSTPATRLASASARCGSSSPSGSKGASFPGWSTRRADRRPVRAMRVLGNLPSRDSGARARLLRWLERRPRQMPSDPRPRRAALLAAFGIAEAPR